LGIALTVHFGENSQGRRRIQILEVTFPEGITGSLLRRLPLERIEQHIRTRPKSVGWYGTSADAIAEFKRIYAALPGPTPRGSESFYRALAAAYLAQIREGVRTPATAIAEASGKPLSTVRGWIHQARRNGYLPAGRRGAAG